MAASGLRLAVAVYLVAALCGSALSQSCGGRPPNVIVVMLDDLGFHDLSIQREIYGDLDSTDVQTPNLDSLIRNGALFTDAYSVAGVCSPARAGFLTGIHPYHSGHRFNPARDNKDRSLGLPLNLTTIPETLKTKGYVSGMFGKWHLGMHDKGHPRNRGFDYFMGFLGSGFPYFEYARYYRGAFEYIFRQWHVFSTVKYLTDDFTQACINFMNKNKENPFFVFLAYNAVHGPYDYLESDVDPSVVSEDRQPHVAMINSVDRGIGRIVESLKLWNLDQCTMIVFTNDNGGHANGANNEPLKSFKGKVWEGGVRVPISFTFPGVIEPNQRIGSPKIASLLDIYPTIEEIAGIPEEDRNQAIEGISLVPHMTLVGQSGPANTGATQPVFGRNEGRGTVRDGKWKAIVKISGTPQAIWLYDLETDIGETTDVLSFYPDVAAALEQTYIDWDANTIPSVFQKGFRDNPIQIKWKKRPWNSVVMGKPEKIKTEIIHKQGFALDDIHWEIFRRNATFRADFTQMEVKTGSYSISNVNSEETEIEFKMSGTWIIRVNAQKGDFLQWKDHEVHVINPNLTPL